MSLDAAGGSAIGRSACATFWLIDPNLGLRDDLRRSETLVIDRVERPSEN